MQRMETQEWSARLIGLCSRVRAAARSALERAARQGRLEELARPVRQGAGDVTYALDEESERAVEAWLAETARERPLSLLTEDSGWRHLGPGTGGAPRELAGFDHGGPRIALDPIDGTRNLMADLRSAWTVVSCAGPGCGMPRLAELEIGIVSEIPDSRAARYRVLAARRGGGCSFELRALEGDEELERRVLRADADNRADRGYFPFFRYLPEQRPELARLEARFFARLAEREGARVRDCYDDQYISNGGQLVLLALGTYRMVADIRGMVAKKVGGEVVTAKPYDLAGAVLCAREAGCVVTAPDGEELDFPMDCETPVDWVGWANAPTARRLGPHLRAVLAEGS
jgi:fructose-1,6-bisphosphatase/inositol monophosphatase family enzyme